MRFRKTLKSLLRGRLFGNRRSFTPDYADSCFERFPDKARLDPGAVESQAAGTHKTVTIDGYLNYLDNRDTPVLFHSKTAFSGMVEHVRRYRRHWGQRIVEQVSADLEDGIPIYNRLSFPLKHAPINWEPLDNIDTGDKQYGYKLHRFYFLPKFAIASLFDARLGTELDRILESWMSYAASKRGGLCFATNLVVIQRLLATVWSLALLGSVDADALCLELRKKLLRILVNDIRYLLPRLGHSVANNHLLADCFARWFIHALFPELAGESGLDGCRQRWEEELLRQTYEDGGSFEQSVHYQELVCEMAAIYLLLSTQNGVDMDEKVHARIGQALKFQIDVGGLRGLPLMIGDSIEDSLLPLGLQDAQNPHFFREIFRFYFDSSLPPTDAEDVGHEAAFWLLGNIAGKTRKSVAPSGNRITGFNDSGLYFMEDTEQNEVIFRTGPAEGVPVFAGHAHADWLSVYYRKSGIPYIVDAGTFTYRSPRPALPAGGQNWRQYFRGPDSHNVVVKEGFDPLGNVSQGDFRPADIRGRVRTCVHVDSQVLGWVEGTLVDTRAMSGCSRSVIFVPGAYAIVYDQLREDERPDWSGLQFCERTSISKRGIGFQAHHVELGFLSVTPTPDYTSSAVFQGDDELPAGWI